MLAAQTKTDTVNEVPLAETIYSALKRLTSDDSTVEYDEGYIINSPNGHPDSSTCDATDAMVQATATKATRADVVVLCLGEEAYTEKPGDIHDLKLQAGQRDLSARLGALGVPTVLVLVQGRPRLLDGGAPPLARSCSDSPTPRADCRSPTLASRGCRSSIGIASRSAATRCRGEASSPRRRRSAPCSGRLGAG